MSSKSLHRKKDTVAQSDPEKREKKDQLTDDKDKVSCLPAEKPKKSTKEDKEDKKDDKEKKDKEEKKDDKKEKEEKDKKDKEDKDKKDKNAKEEKDKKDKNVKEEKEVEKDNKEEKKEDKEEKKDKKKDNKQPEEKPSKQDKVKEEKDSLTRSSESTGTLAQKKERHVVSSPSLGTIEENLIDSKKSSSSAKHEKKREKLVKRSSTVQIGATPDIPVDIQVDRERNVEKSKSVRSPDKHAAAKSEGDRKLKRNNTSPNQRAVIEQEKRYPASPPRTDLEHMIVSLNEEKAMMRENIQLFSENLKFTASSKEEIEKRLKESQAENAIIRKELNETQAKMLALIDSPDSKSVAIKAKNKKLKEKLAALQSESLAKQAQIIELNGEIKILKNENQQIQAKNEKLSAKVQALKAEPKAVSQEQSTLRAEITALNSQLFEIETRYKNQIHNLTLELESAKMQTQRVQTEFNFFQQSTAHIKKLADEMETNKEAPSTPLPATVSTNNPVITLPITTVTPSSPVPATGTPIRTSTDTNTAAPTTPISLTTSFPPASARQSMGPSPRRSSRGPTPSKLNRNSSSPTASQEKLKTSPFNSSSLTPTVSDPEIIPATTSPRAVPVVAVAAESSSGEEEPEDEYAKMKREYEKLMGKQKIDVEEPVVVAPPSSSSSESEDDEYHKLKLEYERKLKEAASPAPKVTKAPIDYDHPDYAAVGDDEFERIKAEYEQVATNVINSLATPEPKPHTKKSVTSPHLRVSENRDREGSSPGEKARPRLAQRPQSQIETTRTTSEGGISPFPNRASSSRNTVNIAKRDTQKFDEETPANKELNKSTDSSKESKPVTPASPAAASSDLAASSKSGIIPLTSNPIAGVKLAKADQNSQALLEQLKALAADRNNMPTFGNSLSITVANPQVIHNEVLFHVHIKTDMRQFGHIVDFDHLDVWRSWSDFEELHKKLIGSFPALPKLPKKKSGADGAPALDQIMKHIANEPEINCLAVVVDFFDNTKYAGEKSSSGPLKALFSKIK